MSIDKPITINNSSIPRTEYVKKNVITGIIYTVITTIFPFLIRTLTIRYLGEEYLGLNSFCVSVLDVLNVANLGIDAALQFHLYVPIAENDKNKIEILLSFYKRIYYAIGLTILISGILIMPFLSRLIKCDMPEGINLYFVFFIFLINQVNGYLFNSTTALFIRANQASYINSAIYIINSIALYSLQMVFIINESYYGFVIAAFFRSLLDVLLLYFVRRLKYSDIHIGKSANAVSSDFKRKIASDTLSVAVYKIRNVSRNSIDSIIISSIMGLKILARYQNYYMVLQVPIILKSILINSLTASFGDYKVMSNNEKTYSLFRVILFMYFALSGWCAIFYYILIQDFITIWVGSDFLLANETALLFAIYIYLLGFGYVMNMLRSAFGVWDKGKMAAFIEMLLNLLLNIGLAYFMGIAGIVLATILTIGFIYIPYELYVLSKYMFVEKLPDIVKIIINNVLWTFLAGSVAVLLCNLIPDMYFWGMCIKAVIGIVVPIGIFILMFGRSSLFKETIASINVKSVIS